MDRQNGQRFICMGYYKWIKNLTETTNNGIQFKWVLLTTSVSNIIIVSIILALALINWPLRYQAIATILLVLSAFLFLLSLLKLFFINYVDEIIIYDNEIYVKGNRWSGKLPLNEETKIYYGGAVNMKPIRIKYKWQYSDLLPSRELAQSLKRLPNFQKRKLSLTIILAVLVVVIYLIFEFYIRNLVR